MGRYARLAFIIHAHSLAAGLAREITVDDVEKRLDTIMDHDPVQPPVEKRSRGSGRDWEQRNKKRRK